MKIGIAIPCYNKHIPRLLELLESMNLQTRQPDVVSVSCSSTEEFPALKQYGFPVLVSTCAERKNPAQNRNIAAKALKTETDIISFFDADDTMHPQRIELLERAFQGSCDIALHNFFFNEDTQLPYPNISQVHIIRNQLSQCYSGCIKLDYIARIAHGHVTVRKHIFDVVHFPEEKEYENREDCVFCYRVFDIPNIQTAYLNYPLSKYIPSNSWTT